MRNAANATVEGQVSRLFDPRASYSRHIRRVIVLHRGVSPTTAIYLRPRLSTVDVAVDYYDILTDPRPELFPSGSFVIVVRYLNPRWAVSLARSRNRLAGVAYLMDDDIPQARNDRSLPRDYARLLSLFWMTFRPFLARFVSEIWLTSAGLAEKYRGENVHRIDPLYVGPWQARTFSPAATYDAPVRIFYHGGRTHCADHAWLRHVIESVQNQRTDTVFEIFGDRNVQRAFADIPRCRVVHRLPWPTYLTYAEAERFDIGLAPAVPGGYNAGRSFNKAYDITRAGAAGVYADVQSFREFVTQGREGVLVAADDPDAWASAIISLVDDPARRTFHHSAALEKAKQIEQHELASPLLDRFRFSALVT